MGTNTLMTRPWMPLTPACAPSAAALPVFGEALAAAPILAASQAPISRVDQVQVRAELALNVSAAAGGRISGINGSTGFKGLTGSDAKHYGDERGVPPRGRPV